MGILYVRPKYGKHCVMCNYWTGDAKVEFVSMGMGYKYDDNACGKCIKRLGAVTRAGSGCTQNYEPSPEAKKLL